MDSLPDIDPNAGIKVTEVNGAMKIENVDYTYQMRPDNKVLDGISLDIKVRTDSSTARVCCSATD